MQLKLIHNTFLDQSVIFYKLKLLLEFIWKAIKGSKYYDDFMFQRTTLIFSQQIAYYSSSSLGFSIQHC